MAHRRTVTRRGLLLGLLPLLGGCGGDGALGPDADLTFLVGDWEAERLIVRSKENPDLAPELIGELGAEYTLSVEPSGQYTSILINPAIPATITVIGQVDLVGDELVFRVSHPPDWPTERYHYTLSSDRLTLVGDFEFPFYGEPEPVELTVQLRKR